MKHVKKATEIPQASPNFAILVGAMLTHAAKGKLYTATINAFNILRHLYNAPAVLDGKSTPYALDKRLQPTYSA